MFDDWSDLELASDQGPSEYAFALRLALFESQRAAARQLSVPPSTISRYESDRITPPVGYLAALSLMLFERTAHAGMESGEREQRQGFFVLQIKKLVTRYVERYKLRNALPDWAHLCRAADLYLSERSGLAAGPVGDPGPEEDPENPATGKVRDASKPTGAENERLGVSTPRAPAAGVSAITLDLGGSLSAPGSAPRPPRLLVGREEDLKRLRARFEGAVASTGGVGVAPLRVLTTLRGWPGVGKTSIAAALAHDAEVAQLFPDGVLWASLGERPSLFAELVAWGRALGLLDLERERTIEGVSARLAAVLLNQRRLLIVDDVWEASHAIPFHVGGRKCAHLVTTRLPEVARAVAGTPDDIYLLEVLSDEAALELLRALAPSVVAADVDGSLELVRALEGLPLAIQVAGRLLHSEASLGFDVATLLGEIREGARLLEAQAPADLAPLGKDIPLTVAALLQRSTDRLDRATRVRFAYLGAFAPKPATFNEAALQSVWEVEDARPTIRVLENRGLLEPFENGRFWVHALLVTHARSLLSS